MALDIYRLDDLDNGLDYKEYDFNDYQNELIELFANSSEGQSRLKEDPGMAFWVERLIDYGYSYTGKTIPHLDETNIEELLTDVFLRKISLKAPEDADNALPTLIALWEYLKREYNLAKADDILDYLRSVKIEEFREWMNDPSRFGMAKSIFTMARNYGFDITNEKEASAFINLYNAKLSLQCGGNASPKLGIGAPLRSVGADGEKRRPISKPSGGGKSPGNPEREITGANNYC